MPDETFPPHDPDFPDVNPATGDERETDEDELSRAELDCEPNTTTQDLNHRYDPEP